MTMPNLLQSVGTCRIFALFLPFTDNLINYFKLSVKKISLPFRAIFFSLSRFEFYDFFLKKRKIIMCMYHAPIKLILQVGFIK